MEAAQSLSEMIEGARVITALTGAGISTGSGIPDFRSPGGIYATNDMDIFDIEVFRRRPEVFYEFARWFAPLLWKARPNAAHRALAEWEAAGREVHIATQNIDDLHERAGSGRVYHLHGDFRRGHCMECGREYGMESFTGVIKGGEVPRCECGGVVKPDIVFFGERLPEDAWRASVAAVQAADLLLVIGTTLLIYPAAALPEYRRDDARLVMIGEGRTHLDNEADLVVREKIEDFLGGVAGVNDAGSGA